MNRIKVQSIDDISILGTDIQIKSSFGELNVFSDGLFQLLKGNLVFDVDDNPVSHLEIFNRRNFWFESNWLPKTFVNVDDAINSETKEINQKKIHELEEKMNGLITARSDLEKQQKEVVVVNENQSSVAEQSAKERPIGKIIQKLDESIDAISQIISVETEDAEEGSMNNSKNNPSTFVQNETSGIVSSELTNSITDSPAPLLENVVQNHLVNERYINGLDMSFSGSAEAGSRIYLSLLDTDGNVIMPAGLYVVAKDDGSWTYNLDHAITSSLFDGDYVWSIYAQDAAGNQSQAQEGSFTIDRSSPTLAFTGLIDDDKSYNNELLTNLTNPVFSGTASENAIIDVVLTDPNTGEVLYAFSGEAIGGKWSVEANRAIVEGQYKINISATDLAGNQSEIITYDSNLIVDTSLPEFGDLFLVKDSDTGFKSDDLLTKDTTPTFSIEGEPGASIVVQIWTGKSVTEEPIYNSLRLTLPESGVLEYTVSEALLNGDFTWNVVMTDQAGNTVTSKPQFVSIDNTAPDLDNIVQNHLVNESYINGLDMSFSGSAEAGSRIYLSLLDTDGNVIMPAGLYVVAKDDGSWTYNLDHAITSSLFDGDYVWSIYAQDAAGNQSQAQEGSFTIDRAAPTLAFTGLGFDEANQNTDTGPGRNDLITNSLNPVFTGFASENSTIEITLTNPNTGEVLYTFSGKSVEGTWSITADQTIAESEYKINIVATDQAGNRSEMITSDGNLIIDREVQGANKGEFTLSENSTLSGVVESGTTVEISGLYDPNGNRVPLEKLYFDKADENGEWSISLPSLSGLAEGKYSYTLLFADIAGNLEEVSGEFIYDITPPDLTFTGLGFDEANRNTDTGPGRNDLITNSLNPVFTGSASENSTIEITLTDPNTGEVLYTFSGKSVDGTWSITADQTIAESEYKINIVATDQAGNQSEMVTSESNLIIDREVQGANKGEFTLSDNFTLSGVVESGTTVEISGLYDPNGNRVPLEKLYFDKADENGDWSITLPSLSSLTEGKYSYTLLFADIAGNLEEVKGEFVYQLPNVPNATALDMDIVESKVFTGIGEAGSLVKLSVGDKVYEAQADSDGDWIVKANFELAKAYDYQIEYTDVNGNAQILTGTVNVDTIQSTSKLTHSSELIEVTQQSDKAASLPLEQLVSSENAMPDDDHSLQSTQTQSLDSVSLSSDLVETKTFTGISQPQTTIKLTIAEKIYETQSDADGDWVIKASFDLPNTYGYQIEYTDNAGNAQIKTDFVNVGTIQITADSGAYHPDERAETSYQSEQISATSQNVPTPYIDDMPDNTDHY